jgi:hypothetical protein
MSLSFLQRVVNSRPNYNDTPDVPKLPSSAVVGPDASLQQQHRFLLVINGFEAAYITNVTRPSYTISTQAFKLLNWTFNYPIELKWNAVSFGVREIFDQELFNTAAGVFMDKLQNLSFEAPTDADMFAPKDLDKRNLINGMGPVRIRMVSDEGRTYEEWELINAFISDLKFSELNYVGDDLTNITVTLTYDYAKLHRHVNGNPDNYAQMVTDSPAKYSAALKNTAENF